MLQFFSVRNKIFYSFNFLFLQSFCPDGGTGRRDGLKHHCLHGLAGSIPARGTMFRQSVRTLLFNKL